MRFPACLPRRGFYRAMASGANHSERSWVKLQLSVEKQLFTRLLGLFGQFGSCGRLGAFTA
jgi:hypothetical protein